ncbi:MAG: hypothetical protein LWX11_02825, partial [Firmicutes bacterium]|nr:hypothetical protein [Bacillota bacterium]
FRSDPQPSFELVVKASEQAEALARSLATVLKGLDRGVPSDAPHPMNDLLAEEVARDRAMGLLFTGFSALALVLAALGLGGALSLAVTQRRPELGLRMALGATGAQILNLVLGQGFRQVALGLMLGLPAAWGLGHILRNQLYGVSPGDPRPMALAALVLGLTAALACLIPALRAARVQPAEALRSE